MRRKGNSWKLGEEAERGGGRERGSRITPEGGNARRMAVKGEANWS